MCERARSKKPLLKKVVGNIYVAQNIPIPATPSKKVHVFQPSDFVQYFPLCDDFGPLNMSSVISFIQELIDAVNLHPACQIVYFVREGRRALTNAVFLLGAYMMIKVGFTSTRVSDCFHWLDNTLIEDYRDATYSKPDFHLTLLDCWRGLERGKEHGWIDLPSEDPHVWGLIDIDEYDQYDDPRNGDLHEIIPGKFVAFKGPQDLGRNEYLDDDEGFRSFSPKYYVDVFQALGVTAVIRLNEPTYDESTFTKAGISHHALEFPDCTSPPAHIVDAFFRVVDNTPGAVAVHCKAGLGRTGTLIALYMLRSLHFSAREAIGWLRLMRPGSVIGEQQQYLCAVGTDMFGRDEDDNLSTCSTVLKPSSPELPETPPPQHKQRQWPQSHPQHSQLQRPQQQQQQQQQQHCHVNRPHQDPANRQPSSFDKKQLAVTNDREPDERRSLGRIELPHLKPLYQDSFQRATETAERDRRRTEDAAAAAAMAAAQVSAAIQRRGLARKASMEMSDEDCRLPQVRSSRRISVE